MPDLWKALGDVYGDGQADGPPVHREPAASERAGDAGGRFGTALPLDDDLAAALSAALVNAPTPGPEAAAADPFTPLGPGAALAPPAAMAPPVPLTPPAPMAPPLAVAPPTPMAPVESAPPVAVPAPPAGEVHGRVTTWIAEIEDRNRRREEGPDLAAAAATGPGWSRIDDDILPSATRKRRRRK